VIPVAKLTGTPRYKNRIINTNRREF